MELCVYIIQEMNHTCHTTQTPQSKHSSFEHVLPSMSKLRVITTQWNFLDELRDVSFYVIGPSMLLLSCLAVGPFQCSFNLIWLNGV